MAKRSDHKEHVTQYILQNPEKFKLEEIKNTRNYSTIRRTVDTQEDFDIACKILEKVIVKKGIDFSWKDVI